MSISPWGRVDEPYTVKKPCGCATRHTDTGNPYGDTKTHTYCDEHNPYKSEYQKALYKNKQLKEEIRKERENERKRAEREAARKKKQAEEDAKLRELEAENERLQKQLDALRNAHV